MKKVCSILMILVILLSVFSMVFAVDTAQNSTGIQKQETVSKVVIVGDKEYHLYDPSNTETVVVNGKNYVRITSYIEKINEMHDFALNMFIFFGILIVIIIIIIIISILFALNIKEQ